MYRINNTQSAIKEIQKFLSVLDKNNPLAQTGIYDSRTRISIENFQRKKGLKLTGTVDETTLNLLYEDYKKALSNEKLYYSTDAYFSFPLKEGDSNIILTNINDMISTILNYHDVYNNVRKSNFFNGETKLGVNELRKIFMLQRSD